MRQMMLQNTADQNDVVALRIGDQDYCIDIDVVREIRGWSPTTVLPHAPAHVTGVINLRGAVVAVVDLAARLGLGKTTATPRHVIVIVAFGAQTVGLLADVVSDILGVDDAAMQPVPDLAADGMRAFITNVIPLEDGRMLRKLDLSKVLPNRSAEGA
ncbi:MAG: chemotaxis protein CheW [Rhodobacteraceae bacterium PARR1]|nr:MAG: chemotaxis protein CheW [Rhodobacteraceae bacterium PARR1]